MSADLNVLVDGLDHAMFVVTAASRGRQAGCLVGFASQVSIDPPRLLVCLSVANHTYDVGRDSAVLAVHVLARGQTELAALFGSATGDEIDKFTRCRWEPGPHGVPLLSDSRVWMVGQVIEKIPLGDHVGFVLDPIDVRRHDHGDALMFSDVQDLSPGHPA
ncbi:flavin reductase family protein [Glutamicibacter protophormiae]|uniref:flavin reductase family protein n=1 Tax=Glutamicibacter protophormiae TaxID=37930 RepID=UPI003A8E6BBD